MTALTGRVIAVTGAASGLGRALAIEAGRRGGALALADVDEDGLHETSAECVGSPAVSLHVVDVADAAAVERYADEALSTHGVVDVLINNAAVQAVGSVRDLTLDDYAWVLGVDLWGVIHCVKVFLPHLLDRPEAHLVTIGSANSLVPFPTASAYVAAKHAIDGFTGALEQELAATPIRVSMVYPGTLATQAARHARHVTATEAKATTQRALTTPERAARLILQGVERDRSRIYIGADVRVLALADRVAPRTTRRALGRAARRVMARTGTASRLESVQPQTTRG